MPGSNNDQPTSAQDQMVRGAVWMIAMRWIIKFTGFINVMILARLLTPDDFGIVAMATIFVGLITTLTDGSFDQAILRDKHAARDKYHAAWTLQVGAGVIATLGIYLAIPLALLIFQDARLLPLLLIAGLKPAVHGFENIGQLDFRKEFNFGREFQYWIIRQFLSIMIVISLTVYFRNFWALALVMPLSSLSTVGLSYMMSPFRPHFTRQGLKEVFLFSRWIMLLDSSTYFGSRVDEAVVGYLEAPETLGHYYMASDLSTMPTRELTMPLDRALVPTMAHFAHDEVRLSQILVQTIAVVGLLCIAAGAGLHAIAEPFVLVVLGETWMPAVPFFKWLALCGTLSALVLSLRSYFMVSGHIEVYSKYHLIYAGCLLVLLAMGAFFQGVESVAPLRTLAALGLLIAIAAFLIRHDYIRLTQLTRELWRPCLAAAFMVGVIEGFRSDPVSLPILDLGLSVLLGIVTFALADALLWKAAGKPEGAESYIMSQISSKLERGRP